MTLPPEKLAEMHLKVPKLGKGKRSTQTTRFVRYFLGGTDLKNDVHLGLGIMIMFTQGEEILFGNVMISCGCFCLVKNLLQRLGNMRLVTSFFYSGRSH